MAPSSLSGVGALSPVPPHLRVLLVFCIRCFDASYCSLSSVYYDCPRPLPSPLPQPYSHAYAHAHSHIRTLSQYLHSHRTARRDDCTIVLNWTGRPSWPYLTSGHTRARPDTSFLDTNSETLLTSRLYRTSPAIADDPHTQFSSRAPGHPCVRRVQGCSLVGLVRVNLPFRVDVDVDFDNWL